MLEEKGIQIIKEVKLMQIITDKDKEKPDKNKGNAFGDNSLDSADEQEEVNDGAILQCLLFKKLNEVDDEEEEDEDEDENRSRSDRDSAAGGMSGDENSGDDDKSQGENGENGHAEKKKRRKKNEVEIEARVLITCGHRDVDPDVFKSIHDNGLVYNGRLIVDRHF